MAEAHKDLQKATDDHLKRLFDRYKSNSKVFTATHIGHICLSVVFVLSILFPFLYLQIDARKTNAELELMSQSIAQLEQRAAIYLQWKADLQAGMKRVTERFRSEMAANPRFWREFNIDTPVYQSMIAGAHRFWADHQFEEIGRRMELAAESRRGEIAQLSEKKEQIQKSRQSLNNALKNIKTRFGKLGLEVEDAILLAPVAFSALFLVAALNLCSNIRLRESFHRLFQARDLKKLALTDSEIALAMPLWLDPLAPPVQRRIKFGMLRIPALASALTLLVVFYCWTLPEVFPEMSGFDYVKYLLDCLIGAGLFILGFQKIRAAIGNYDASPPAAGAS